MAISRSFAGQTLSKPGAYSVSRVDNAQGISVGENNTLMLIGESSDGVTGAEENSRLFSNIQRLVDFYGTGDIVDAALAASRPSLTPGISGPTNYIVYKTNPSLKALYTLTASFTAVAAGTAGISFNVTYPINASGETYTANVDVSVDIEAADTDIIAASKIVAALNAGDGAPDVFGVFDISNTTSGAETAEITFTAKRNGSQFGVESTSNLSGKVIWPATGDIVISGTTTLALASVAEARSKSILDALGGSTVATLQSAFVDAFNFDPNVIIPLWSNASTGEQADNRPDGGINRGVSDDSNGGAAGNGITYRNAAVQLQDHLQTRSSVTVRKEAQGFIGAADQDWRTTYGNLNTDSISTFLLQAVIQDVRIVDSQGVLTWKAPHIMAALLAGTRLGATVGEPLTFKVINANGVGHFIDASTGMPINSSSQFRPGFDFEEAITEGLTFTEIASGGNRVVVDNTRYKTDDSFVFNRGSVIEASQFVARTSRLLLERLFVGQKVSNGAAESLKNVLRNYLIQLNQDNIITSSEDAPFGFVEETFTVTINGNTAEVQVEVKPVQGLDFIFINFTLGNITQQA